ncbi:unnamed protein product [Rotaria sordida]|uniref:Uncharacterized protein n=1 Tax=Rotaria sordida TaxID=392033 RepID=A0A819UM19_9BILA|nr:unnamed protein product [Rotaria sordida]CAF4097909.1 unnamed protein product [Rotaria sordida]
MIFYSSLFYLIYLLINKTNGLLENDNDLKKECFVKIETDNGFETCFNHECYRYKDPWRIVQTYLYDQPCYLHYLKLAFSNYDQLLVFIELQTSNNNALETFFVDHDSKPCLIELEIDNIYPFNSYYFLSEDMLKKLGGIEEKIHLLKMEIKNWYRSIRSVIQLIDNDMIGRQPFQRITILFPCNIIRTKTQLVLVRDLKYQEQSTCPTQIKILSDKDILTSSNYTTNIDYDKPTNIRYNDSYFIKKTNLTNDSYNKSDSYYNNKKKSNKWTLFEKIAILFIIIILIIAFALYHFLTSPSKSNNK